MRFVCVFKAEKKPYKLLLLLLVCLALYALAAHAAAHAAEAERGQLEKEIQNKVGEQLDRLDTEGLQDFIDSLGGDEYQIFGGTSFRDMAAAIVSGEFRAGYDSFFGAVLGLIGRESVRIMPTLASIAVVAVLSGILAHMRSGVAAKPTGDIVYFVCYGAVLLLLMNAVAQLTAAAGGAGRGSAVYAGGGMGRGTA